MQFYTSYDRQDEHIRMTQSPIPKIVTQLAIPTIASQLVTSIYNMADTFFVSHISQSAAAAIGVVFSLMSLIQAVGMGIGTGVGSIVARRLGAQKDGEADMIASSGLLLALTLGLLLMIFGLAFLEPLVLLLGSTDSMLPYSYSYAQYILAGAPVMCVSFVLNNTLRYQGKASFAMIGLCVGAVLNVYLDPLLIADMGIAGAAIATLISQTVGLAILTSAFIIKISIVRISVSAVSRNTEDYLLIVRTGFPAICRQGLASFSSALLNFNAKAYGDAAVAAITIANKLYLFVRNIILGLGQGFQPVAGYNYGAGKIERAKKAFSFTCTLGTLFCLVMTAVLVLNASAVIAWFRSDDLQVMEIGTMALYLVCGVMPVLAYSTYVNQLYQCLGYSRQASFLSCCRQGIFYVPALLILRFTFGLLGIQMAQPVADMVTFVVSVPFHFYLYRVKLKKKEK